MIASELTMSVNGRARLGDGFVRVRDSGLIGAVAQFLYDEAALLDEWRLDDWLALFHPDEAAYVIPSPEDHSDDPVTTLHLLNDSMPAASSTTSAAPCRPVRDSSSSSTSFPTSARPRRTTGGRWATGSICT
jgi:Ring hydroxylating beta subunit